MPRFVDYESARQLHLDNKTWCVMLENTTPGHSKFWEGRETTESVVSGHVLVRYGRIGSDGTTILKNWKYFEQKVREKLAEGYVYHRDTGMAKVEEPRTGFKKKPEKTVVVRRPVHGIVDEVEVDEIVTARADRIRRGVKPMGAADEFSKKIEQEAKQGKEEERKAPIPLAEEVDIRRMMERRKRASSW